MGGPLENSRSGLPIAAGLGSSSRKAEQRFLLCAGKMLVGQIQSTPFDRGRPKIRRNSATGRAERNSSRFFCFRTLRGPEKANKISPREQAQEFSHSLDPLRSYRRKQLEIAQLDLSGSQSRARVQIAKKGKSGANARAGDGPNHEQSWGDASSRRNRGLNFIPMKKRPSHRYTSSPLQRRRLADRRRKSPILCYWCNV